MVRDLRMWLYRATPGNPRQMHRRRPLSPANRTPPPAGLGLHPVLSRGRIELDGQAVQRERSLADLALETDEWDRLYHPIWGR